MIRALGTFCGSVVLLASCDRSQFPGFKPVNDEVHFQLRMLGDGERLPTDSDSALVRVRMAVHGDAPGSLFSTERWYGSIEEVLPEGSTTAIHFHEGDSVSMVASARRVPWAAIGAERGGVLDSAWIDLEFSLFELRSLAESRELARASRPARTKTDEDSTLARFFATEPSEWPHFMGVFHRSDPGNPKRPKVQSGQVVTIAYTGRFLDTGRVFDDTHATHQPLTFRLGDPEQVIKGIEIAVHLLPDGGKGRFIIPAELAFGAAGSSNGIVPPWTPVLYEVEVMDVSEGRAAGQGTDSASVPL